MQLFKIRCSAIHQIMGGATSKPTVKQMEELARLEAKDKRTDVQQARMIELISKRDAPPALQQGAKTYCEKWLKEQLYNRSIEFSSKYTEKGTDCEQSGIELVSDMMGYGFISKNEQHYENDFITGTPDLVLSETVEDIKCPWDFSTFPLFDTILPTDAYYWQMQGYMSLTGKSSAAVNYCLVDAPEYLIEREARSVSFKAGFDEVEMELYEQVEAKMTYRDVPNNLKFKRFHVERSESDINAICIQVKLCREYIQSLLNNTPIL